MVSFRRYGICTGLSVFALPFCSASKHCSKGAAMMLRFSTATRSMKEATAITRHQHERSSSLTCVRTAQARAGHNKGEQQDAPALSGVTRSTLTCNEKSNPALGATCWNSGYVVANICWAPNLTTIEKSVLGLIAQMEPIHRLHSRDKHTHTLPVSCTVGRPSRPSRGCPQSTYHTARLVSSRRSVSTSR